MIAKKRRNDWRAIGARVLNRRPRRYCEALVIIERLWPDMGGAQQRMYALEAYRGMVCLHHFLAQTLPSYKEQGYNGYRAPSDVDGYWREWACRLRPATVLKWATLARAL